MGGALGAAALMAAAMAASTSAMAQFMICDYSYLKGYPQIGYNCYCCFTIASCLSAVLVLGDGC
jgi:hypothetical protein